MKKELCNIGTKIKLEKDLKTCCCKHIIKSGSVIEIWGTKSLYRAYIELTKQIVVLSPSGGLHHVKISSIQGVVL